MKAGIGVTGVTGRCLILLVLGGCATLSGGAGDEPSAPPAPAIREAARPLPAATATPSPPAVTALLERALAARDAGDDDLAAVHLERAIRIAPRDPRLWLELARTHFDQGDFAAAAEFAGQASRLSGDDAALRQEATRLMAMAERQRG